MKLSKRLYACAQTLWPRYLQHPFVREMAEGTLPVEKFRFYMLQDSIYLRDYMKILAAILLKSDDFEEMRFLCGEMSNTIEETLRMHIPYMKRLGIPEAELRETAAHIDNSAYTQYMLCTAQAGDVLTGLVLLLNCSWSYAYIAEKMAERYAGAVGRESYSAWFSAYLSVSYRQANQALIDRIDGMAGDIREERVRQLCEIFAKCCLFELRFWDAVYAGKNGTERF